MFPKLPEIHPLGIGIAIVAIVLLSLIIDINALKTWVEQAGFWAPLIFILLKVSTIVIAPISGGPLYPLAGIVFGFWPGVLYVVLADFVGYTTAFMLSRFLGQKIVLRMIAEKEGGMLAKIMAQINTPKGFFFACMTFFPVPELLSYGAGLTKLPYLTFISILLPLSAIASSILVLIGASFDFGDKSLLVSIGIPAIAGSVMLISGALFLYFAKKENTAN